MLLSHTARRSFATNAYKAGVPLPSIQAITGHSSRGTTAPLPETGRGGKGRHSVKGFQGYHQNIRRCLWKNQGLTLLATCSNCPT
ncbi:tyrosine-type recombinase/integrase [Phocaeicola vulgatus]|nr:tyrosine-type recombinase/integrase [Phocaeicola vulgatus]